MGKRIKLLLFSSFLTLVLIFILNCNWLFFRRNPNLKLFFKPDIGSAFNPVVSPEGNKVYYLWGSGPVFGEGGELMRINADGSGNRLILTGEFCAIAISPDGSKLALATGNFYSGGYLVITDTVGSKLDTIPVGDSITDVEFGSSDDEIYYFRNRRGIYKWSYQDSTERLVLDKRVNFRDAGGFDMSGDSLLFFDGNLYQLPDPIPKKYFEMFWWPRFSPKRPANVVGVNAPGFSRPNQDLCLVKIDSDSYEKLNAVPYRYGVVSQPYWWPTGDRVIFSGAPASRRGPFRPGKFELWILEKVK